MNNIEIAHALYDALEAGDIQGFRSRFADNAIVWHNFDNVEQSIDQALANLHGMAQMFSALTYTERRYMATEDGAVLQHVGNSFLHDGRVIHTPIMQRMMIENGLVTRIEEYLDSTAMAQLFAPQGK